MSITDELRDYTEEQIKWLDMTKVHYRKLFDIADRIDAEYEEAIQQAMTCDGWMPVTDESMNEHGWVRLPKDADGVPIHAGDVMNKGKVTCIRDCGKGWEVVLDNLYTYDASSLCHYAPTVEDVLREFAVEVCGEPALTIRSGVVEEYASRLRLAGDDE